MYFIMCLYVDGQTDFRPGIILLKPNDSVTGKIEYKNDIKNAEVCNYRLNSGNAGTYTPFEIYGYRFTEGKFYISKYIKKDGKLTPSFVEYLVKGKKNMYYMRDIAGSHFLIDYNKDTVLEVIYKVDHIYKDGVEYIGDAKIHQAYLKTYFQDCPELFKEIEMIQVPDISNMIALTKKYNHITCGDSGCIVFNKRSYKFKVNLEFRFGMLQYNGSGGLFTPQYEGLVHFWLPRSNERMYLITGFIYNPVTYSFYKIPLKFEYQWPFRVVKPVLEGGVNFIIITQAKHLEGVLPDIPLSAGILMCPASFIAINLSLEGEFYPFVFNEFLTAYSFNVGFVIRI
jgi:hypothetical protein